MALCYLSFKTKEEASNISNLVDFMPRLTNNIKLMKEQEIAPDFEVVRVGRLLSADVIVHKDDGEETNEICPMIGFECECTYANEKKHQSPKRELYFISIWWKNDDTGSLPFYGEGNNEFGKCTTFGNSDYGDTVQVKEELCSINMVQDAIKKYMDAEILRIKKSNK